MHFIKFSISRHETGSRLMATHSADQSSGSAAAVGGLVNIFKAAASVNVDEVL